MKQSKGYKLIEKSKNYWQLITPLGIFSGTLREVCIFSVIRLGFTMKELERGVIEMNQKFHDAAVFGIFKKFISTYDIREKYEKIIN